MTFWCIYLLNRFSHRHLKTYKKKNPTSFLFMGRYFSIYYKTMDFNFTCVEKYLEKNKFNDFWTLIFQVFLALCSKIRDHDEEYACTRCYCKKLYHFFFQFNLVYTTNMFCYQQTLINRQYEIYIPGVRCFFLVAEEINVTKLYKLKSQKQEGVGLWEVLV